MSVFLARTRTSLLGRGPALRHLCIARIKPFSEAAMRTKKLHVRAYRCNCQDMSIQAIYLSST